MNERKSTRFQTFTVGGTVAVAATALAFGPFGPTATPTTVSTGPATLNLDVTLSALASEIAFGSVVSFINPCSDDEDGPCGTITTNSRDNTTMVQSLGNNSFSITGAGTAEFVTSTGQTWTVTLSSGTSYYPDGYFSSGSAAGGASFFEPSGNFVTTQYNDGGGVTSFTQSGNGSGRVRKPRTAKKPTAKPVLRFTSAGLGGQTANARAAGATTTKKQPEARRATQPNRGLNANQT